MIVHQKYVNELDKPLEIVFMMPRSSTFTCHKIEVDFHLTDGSSESLETQVVERSAAREQYEDAVAEGKTAVLALLPEENIKAPPNMMKISLGNMPPLSIAYLRVYCN